MSFIKTTLENSSKFPGKCLCRSVILIKFLDYSLNIYQKKRLLRSGFPVISAKFSDITSENWKWSTVIDKFAIIGKLVDWRNLTISQDIRMQFIPAWKGEFFFGNQSLHSHFPYLFSPLSKRNIINYLTCKK